MKYFFTILNLLVLFSEQAVSSFDGRKFVDGLIIGNFIIINENERTYTKGFRKHVTEELYRVVENEVGKALLFDIVQNFKDVPIIVEAIDITDENERELGPQTSQRMDNKIYVTLYNLADKARAQIEEDVSNRNKMLGFSLTQFLVTLSEIRVVSFLFSVVC